MQVNVRGHRWDLVFMERLPSGAAGECDDVGTPRKAIWVATQQKPVDLLDTIIHELLHAALPDLCEETVLETATDLAKILNRLGAKIELPTGTTNPKPARPRRDARVVKDPSPVRSPMAGMEPDRSRAARLAARDEELGLDPTR